VSNVRLGFVDMKIAGNASALRRMPRDGVSFAATCANT